MTRLRGAGMAAPGLLLVGCAESAASRDTPPIAPAARQAAPLATASGAGSTAVRRLLPGPLGPGAEWEVTSSWHQRPLPATLPESVARELRHDTFDPPGDLAASGWLVDPAFGALVDRKVRDPLLPRLAAGRLELPQPTSVAAFVVAASPITPYVVNFRVTRPAGSDEEPRLFVVDLTEDLSAERDPVAFVERVVHGKIVENQREIVVQPHAEGDEHRQLEIVPQTIVHADGSETWRAEFSSLWRTRSLAFWAAGSKQGDGRVTLDDVTLHELPARALLGLPAGSPSNFDLPRPSESLEPKLRVTKVRCDWESRRALLLPRGGRARCRFAAPATAAGGQVELGLAIVREERLCLKGPRHERVRVVLNGEPRELPLTLAFDTPSCWQEVVLPLPAVGSASCTLEIEVLGDDDAMGPLIAMSDPIVYPSDPHARPAAAAPFNVVVISLDTMRADRLGRRVRGRSLTPRLDALAARSIVFEQALANASYTLPSHVSLFTSQRPGEHGVLTVFDRFSPVRSANFARRVAQHGYATAAFTSGGMLNAEYCGIDDGFDRFGEIDALLSPGDRLREIAPLQARHDYNLELARRNRLDQMVLPWLGAHRGSPFFLFLHTYLPHNYQPETELCAAFTAGLPATPLRISGPIPYRESINAKYLASPCGQGDRRFSFEGEGVPEFTPARDLPWVEALYDATIAQADRDVGRLLDELARLQLSDRTIVVVTADHGEELLEHGNLSHARSLFDEILRVPLLIAIPGAAPRRVAEPVEQIDLAPTLLAKLGIAADERMRGVDLLAADWEARSVTIHEGVETAGKETTLRAARTRGNKLILQTKVQPREMDLLDSSVLQQLIALGYLQFNHVPGGAPSQNLPTGFFDLERDPGEQGDLVRLPELSAIQSSRMAELVRQLLDAPIGGAEASR